jgi:hypothetical protein
VLLALALTLDATIAKSMAKHRSGNIALWMLFSVLLTLAGAIVAFAVIATIAIIRHHS